MSIDISNSAQENHSYAVYLAAFENLIVYKNSTFEIADVLEKELMVNNVPKQSFLRSSL